MDVLRPSRRIDMAELHEGTMLSTLFDLLTSIGLYMSTCEQRVPKELPLVRTSTCKRGITHILLDLFAKNTECTHGKNHLGACLLFYLSAKDTAVELI